MMRFLRFKFYKYYNQFNIPKAKDVTPQFIEDNLYGVGNIILKFSIIYPAKTTLGGVPMMVAVPPIFARVDGC
jgi:hypothetical protein